LPIAKLRGRFHALAAIRTIEIDSQIVALCWRKLDDAATAVLNQTVAIPSKVFQRIHSMFCSPRMAGAAALLMAMLLQAGRADAVQNWFGYGGVFGPQAYYTYYAPQPVVAGYAPTAVSAYSYPTVVSAPVVSYSTSRVIVPVTAYAPLTTSYAPVTSCRPVVAYSPTCGTYSDQCGTYCGAPAAIAPSISAPVTVVPAPTTVTPLAPRYGTPIYQPPGIYPQAVPAAPISAPPMTFPPTTSPGLPTSSVSPADQPPTLSGYTPYSYSTTVAPPTTVSQTPAAPADAASVPPVIEGATQPSTSQQRRPDLDISVPNEADEELSPVAPAEGDKAKEADESATGPKLQGDEANTASAGAPRTGLLSTATWRAVRPSSRKIPSDRKTAVRRESTHQ
jgi:hypothetical protein